MTMKFDANEYSIAALVTQRTQLAHADRLFLAEELQQSMTEAVVAQADLQFAIAQLDPSLFDDDGEEDVAYLRGAKADLEATAVEVDLIAARR